MVTSAKDIFKTSEAKDWPTTVGVVVSSRAVQGCSKSFNTEVLYQYTVGVTSYVGNRLIFGAGDCGSKNDAQAKANQYPVKSPVTVHFNPELPSEAVIIAGKVPNGTWWLILILPFGIILFALVSWSFLRNVFTSRQSGRQT
jgi:hypothetical protein